MLICREIPELASDYIDREGSAKNRMMMTVHLMMCGRCRDYVRGLKIARSVTEESLRGPVSSGLLNALGLKDLDRRGSFKEPNE